MMWKYCYFLNIGCGKTSLLNVLACRLSASGASNMKLAGKVLVNGKMRNELTFRKQSAYVLQDDKLYAHLTVFETLMLSAQVIIYLDIIFFIKFFIYVTILVNIFYFSNILIFFSQYRCI